MKTWATIIALMLALALSRAASAEVFELLTPKAVDELQLMTTAELITEAHYVCIAGYVIGPTAERAYNRRLYEQLLDYIVRIGRVARQRTKQTELPGWVKDFQRAMRAEDRQLELCHETWEAAQLELVNQ
jgi:hypothetical protein